MGSYLMSGTELGTSGARGGEEQPEVPDDELRELLFTGLRLAGDRRRVLEARESACIAALRGLGATWKQIAEALELRSPTAAHQHAARLARWLSRRGMMGE